MSINKAIIIGRLGQDPELKKIPSGQSVCKFSVATSEKYKKKDGTQVDNTDWHNIVCWGYTADNCAKYLNKGSQIYLEGKITTRSWETDSGEKRYATEIIAQSVQFLDSKPEGNASAPKDAYKPTNLAPANVQSDLFPSDTIPF